MIEELEKRLKDAKDEAETVLETINSALDELSGIEDSIEDFKESNEYSVAGLKRLLNEILDAAEDADYPNCSKTWRRVDTKQELIAAIRKEVLS